MPIHPVSAWTQTLQPDTHRAAANLGLAEIDARALAVGHLHGAKRRLETLGEGRRDLPRRRADRSADGRGRTGEHGVSVRAASAQAKQQEGQDEYSCSHGLLF